MAAAAVSTFTRIDVSVALMQPSPGYVTKTVYAPLSAVTVGENIAILLTVVLA